MQPETIKHVAMPTALLLIASFNASVAAQELVAHHRVLDQQTEAGITSGTIELWVGNLSNTDVRDVDFRALQPDLLAGDHGVLQFGSVPADEARPVTGTVVGSELTPLDGPIAWQVDFAGPSGPRQVLVSSFPLDGD